MTDRWSSDAVDLHLRRHREGQPSNVTKVGIPAPVRHAKETRTPPRFDTPPRKQDRRATRETPVMPFEVLSTNPLTIRIPVKLPSLANARGSHWSGKASLAARVRRIVKSALMVPAKPALPVRVTMVRVSPGTLDDDNLATSCKPARDEIADWLGLPSDRDPRAKFVTEQRKAKGYACEVTFEPMTGDTLVAVSAARGGG